MINLISVIKCKVNDTIFPVNVSDTKKITHFIIIQFRFIDIGIVYINNQDRQDRI